MVSADIEFRWLEGVDFDNEKEDLKLNGSIHDSLGFISAKNLRRIEVRGV